MNIKNCFCFLLLNFLYAINCISVQAQLLNNNNERNYISAINAIRQLKPVEKLYLQTDKPYYTSGDTLHFKAYLVNGDFFTQSIRSGLLYIELDNQDGKAAKLIMVPVMNGLAWGEIELEGKVLPEANYTLRAYTNWMRNFGDDYIFKKLIPITATADNILLVKSSFKQQNNKIESTLQFISLDGHIQALKDMELKVMAGRKNISKDKLTTGIDGTLKINFDIPEGVSIQDLAIKAQAVNKTVNNNTTTPSNELAIPVTINRLENTDVQFMPEGGNLVAGISTKVGIKAISEDGKGITIVGKITDNNQQVVAPINTTHAGMGSFEFTPKAGEIYTAKLNGINRTYQLPPVNLTGTALKITTTADSLQIAVNSTIATSTNTWYLIGQSRGVVCYAQTITINNIGNNQPQTILKSAAKNLFPTGIARFTLINSSHQPVNERLVFINHHDDLHISISANKPNYTTRDSIALAIEVKDKDNKPVQGAFSISITDDSQVKIDSLGSTILNNLLLTSDLKGNIEEPDYYFLLTRTKNKPTWITCF